MKSPKKDMQKIGTKYKKIIGVLFVLIGFFLGSHQVFSEEILLSSSGNASGSSNEMHVTVSNNTSATQNNQSNTNNSVNIHANTGGNTNSENSGNASIRTGNISEDTSISNQNINSNLASVACCTAELAANIVSNGPGSLNTINATTSNNTVINQNSNASITNSVATHANTGNNTAHNNDGSVEIKTGNIHAESKIINKNLNVSLANRLACCDLLVIKITGNAEGSKNTINVNQESMLDVRVKNVLDLLNRDVQNLDTGDNDARGNAGSILIATGDILAIKTIINENMNVSKVSPPVGGEKPGGGEEEKPKPPGGNNPLSTTPSGGGGNNEIGQAGQTLGAANGKILPKTGMFLFLFTLANLMFFMLGWYLRFRSGCSPGVIA